MVSSLLYLLIVLVVVGVIAWVCRALLPDPFAWIATIVCGLIAFIAIVYFLIGLLNGSGSASLSMATAVVPLLA